MIDLCYLFLFYPVWVKSEESMKYYKTGLILEEPESITRSLDFNLSLYVLHDHEDRPVPENFDSRIEWPHCESLTNIQNQGNCGWCWAVNTASVATDRLCISTNGTDKFEYSAVDMLTCCEKCTPRGTIDPCQIGGRSFRALIYLAKNGVVSADCKPPSPMITVDGKTPPCEQNCTEKRFIEGFKAILIRDRRDRKQKLKQVQIDIMLYGPLIVSMKACKHFQRFFNHKRNPQNAEEIYKSTFYENAKDRRAWHAAKLVGWGERNGTRYWLGSSSWGSKWGDNGFFRIIRGRNLLDMEDNFYIPYHQIPPRPQMASTIPTNRELGQYSCANFIRASKNIVLVVVIILF